MPSRRYFARLVYQQIETYFLGHLNNNVRLLQVSV